MPVAVPVVTPFNVPKNLGDNDPQGTVVEYPTGLLGFFGTTPITQPYGAGTLTGAVGTVTQYSSAQSPTIVAANTTGERAMTVTGVAATDFVIVNKPTAQAGLVVGSARASATNAVQVSFGNATGSGITPTASESYFITTIPTGMYYTAVLSPAAVPANSTVEQSFTVAGVNPGGIVAVNKPTTQAGLLVTNARITAPNTVAIEFMNFTASPITPTAGETYRVFSAVSISLASVMVKLSATLTPAAVAANTSAEQTFTVTGLAAGTFVEVAKPSFQAGLSIGQCRVSAANTLAITFVNISSAAITPASETYTIGYFPSVPTTTPTTQIGSIGTGNHGDLVALGLVGGP